MNTVLDNLLAKTEKPQGSSKPKKNGMPIIMASEEVRKAVDEHAEADMIIKKATAVKENAAAVITEITRKQQDTDGFAGKYQSSYLVPGHQHQVRVTYQNRYSINGSDEGELKNLLGNNFPDMIERDITIQVKKEVLGNQEKLQALVDLLGEKAGDFLESTVSLKVKEHFTRDVYRVVTADKLAMVRVYARQYSPSIVTKS